MFNLLFTMPQFLEDLDKKLNSLAYKFDSPFTGSVVFIVLLAIAWIAIKSYSKR